MEFAQRHAISDVCILVEDLERSVRFYVDRLGFRPLHRAPGFADFAGAGLTLARLVRVFRFRVRVFMASSVWCALLSRGLPTAGNPGVTTESMPP